MAKNKKKVVDLKPKSITGEELASIQGLVRQMNIIQMDLGKIEVRKHMMNHEYTKLQESMQEEQVVLRKKYGDVNINIENGEISSPEDVEVNKKD